MKVGFRIALLTLLPVLMAVAIGVRVAAWRDPGVRLGYVPIIASVPVYLAQDQRLSEKQHVRFQTVSFSSSNDMVSALVSGQVDILPAVSLIPLVHLEIQHPGRVRIFAHSRMLRENSTYRIVVKDASPIRDLRGLEKKRLGVFPGTSATRLVSAFLKRNGVDTEVITFVPLPTSAQVSSLESGSIDALFAYDPLVAIGDPGRYRALSNSVYAELSQPCPLGVSVISREFERRHPGRAAESIRAVQEAITYSGTHPEEVRDLLPRFTRMTPQMAARVPVADLTLSNTLDVAALQRFTDVLYEIGEVPERIDAKRLIESSR